jgi:hypothetical protein
MTVAVPLCVLNVLRQTLASALGFRGDWVFGTHCEDAGGLGEEVCRRAWQEAKGRAALSMVDVGRPTSRWNHRDPASGYVAVQSAVVSPSIELKSESRVTRVAPVAVAMAAIQRSFSSRVKPFFSRVRLIFA